MSKIEWTEQTWNPVTGCDRVSPGCDHCYALTMAARLKLMGQPKYQRDGDPRTSGPGFGVTCHPEALGDPFKWRSPRRVFVNSMSDLFHRDVPLDFILSVWRTMLLTPQHTYQVLTKRPQRMQRIVNSIAWRGAHTDEPYLWPDVTVFDEDGDECWNEPATEDDDLGEGEQELPNVWLGTSIESDLYAFRADHLRATPAAIRFLSCEPLLGPLPSLDFTGIDWVIVGAESGHGARPMANEWAEDIATRATAAGCAVFVKQLSGGIHARKDVESFPIALRRREYPEVAA